MSDVSFKNIHWSGTLILMLMRLAAATVVALIVMLASNPQNFAAESIVTVPAALACMLVMGALCATLGNWGVPWIGFGAVMAFLTIIGDPILWIIGKFMPGLLPADFAIVNRPVLFLPN